MITEIVTFKLPDGSVREDVFANFEKTAAIWGDNPDLIRKNYLYDAQAGVAGGVYLWKEKAHAQKWHGAEFPSSQFYETPIVVDNLTGVIVK